MTSKPPAEEPGHPTPATSPSGLEWREVIHGSRPGDQIIRIARHRSFRPAGPGILVTRRGLEEPTTLAGRLARLLFGSPIPSRAEATERVGILKGLALFASDNISSSAYATEEIMRVLILAGVASLVLTMPITVVIVSLIAIVVISYRQVIAAYPGGGGSYIVARENLGTWPGLTAAAALLTDYFLTVAVSISAGVAALTSAFPELFAYRALISIVVVIAMTVMNMRGIRESGNVFAIPTYIYIVAIFGVLGLGLFRAATGGLPSYSAPAEWATAHGAEPLALLLVLRAFASGSVALTGTEAVSNGVPAFSPPEVKHAQIVLVAMGTLFGTIFLGMSFLSTTLGILPDPSETETVVSQLTRTIVGGTTPYYYLVQFSTAVLLLLAANTAFNGFPLLASVLARDRYLPRQFSFRGDRLAFTGGIIALAVGASVLIWIYQGSVTGLIPLYTIGVFLAFTLSQAGLVRRWWLHRQERGWQFRLVTNGVGAAATGVVAVVVGVSKFALGAWMVLLALPVLVAMMWAVNRHYRRMEQASRPETPLDPTVVHVRAIVPVVGIDLPARQAIAYAQAIAPPGQVVAVHVTDDEKSARAFQQAWSGAGVQIPLVIIESPYRSLIGPFLSYVDALRETHPKDTITVILPEYVPGHWWEHFIHNQTALRIKTSLLFHPGVVVVSVPYHMQEP